MESFDQGSHPFPMQHRSALAQIRKRQKSKQENDPRGSESREVIGELLQELIHD
jgi:hypothetical protein